MYQYDNNDIFDFSEFSSSDRLAIIVSLLIAVEVDQPGLINHVFRHLALAVQGFSFRSRTSNGEQSMKYQRMLNNYIVAVFNGEDNPTKYLNEEGSDSNG